MNQAPSQSNNALATIITALVLGLSFNYLFLLKIPGVSFILYVALILVGLILLANSYGRRLPKSVATLCLPLIFFSSMLAVRASPILSFFNVIATLAMLLVIVVSIRGHKLSQFYFADYLKLFALPASFLTPAVQTLINLVPTSRQPNQRLRQIIKGAIITLPVLLVFIALFSSADLVFSKYLAQIFSFNLTLDPLFTFRTIIVLIVTFGFTGAYSYIFKPAPSPLEPSTSQPRFRLGHIETNILLGSVGILFLIFILVQFTYLFGGQANITALGLTYAQYARKGFFELVAVALIAFILIRSVQKAHSSNPTQLSQAFKRLSSTLIAEVMIIMASAFLRLLIYEQAYGFTQLRFYSHVFVIWLAVVYIFLLYKILANRSEQSFIFKSAISAFATLALLNLFNPDAFLARQNIQNFAATGKLDTYQLATLSDDALPETIKALDLPDQNLSRSFAHHLYWFSQTHQNSPAFDQWTSANLARTKASQILTSKAPILEANKDYQPVQVQP